MDVPGPKSGTRTNARGPGDNNTVGEGRRGIISFIVCFFRVVGVVVLLLLFSTFHNFYSCSLEYPHASVRMPRQAPDR